MPHMGHAYSVISGRISAKFEGSKRGTFGQKIFCFRFSGLTAAQLHEKQTKLPTLKNRRNRAHATSQALLYARFLRWYIIALPERR
eukprot:3014261-Pleurochrysis_carterae.AAC.1